jgi:hypothetical protein
MSLSPRAFPKRPRRVSTSVPDALTADACVEALRGSPAPLSPQQRERYRARDPNELLVFCRWDGVEATEGRLYDPFNCAHQILYKASGIAHVRPAYRPGCSRY